MKKAFLKCYYGYRNLWDEILFFWVLSYLQSNLDIKRVTVQVGDKAFMQERVTRNEVLVSALAEQELIKKIKFIQVWRYSIPKTSGMLKVFGGGEVFARKNGLWAGWNYVAKYRREIVRGNFVILGGLDSAKTRRQKLFYRLVLPRAQSVVLREATSYQIALSYWATAVLHEDFAVKVIQTALKLNAKYAINEKNKSQKKLKPYVLVNLHPSVATEQSFQKIENFVKGFPTHDVYYVRAGQEDKKFFNDIQSRIPHAKLYNWTEYDICQIVDFFEKAQAWIWARLHFLLLLKECGVKLHTIIYAEKVQKLIGSH